MIGLAKLGDVLIYSKMVILICLIQCVGLSVVNVGRSIMMLVVG